jgi:anti-sigma factor RsiW
MTVPERPIAEEDLHAYVDEQLDPAARAGVARYLEQHPAVAQRIAAYAAQVEGLRAAFAARAAEPIPPTLNLSRLLEQRLASGPSWWRVAAAVALAVGVGAGGGWVLRAMTEPQGSSGIAALEREAVANHLVYAPDTRHPIELGAAQRDDLTRWVSSRLKHPVAPPDLTTLGYRFMGGRLVATTNGAAALFLYNNDRDTRLSIFVRPMQSDETTPILVLDIGDVDGCAWVDHGIGYTLIAAASYPELQRMSEYVRQQIGGRT